MRYDIRCAMWARLKAVYRRLGRMEKVLFFLLIAYLLATYLQPGGLPAVLAAFVLVITGTLVALRLTRRVVRRVIWRLRNRLLVAYAFIAVVPIVLILTLVALGAWILTGQIATYMVITALDKRTSDLMAPVQGLALTAPRDRADRIRWIGPYFREQNPGLELLVRDPVSETRYPDKASLDPPPKGWPNATGLVLKNDTLYLWAYAIQGDRQALMLAPLGRDTLAELVPDLGDIVIATAAAGRTPEQRGAIRAVMGGKQYRPEWNRPGQRERLPPAVNRFDSAVTYLAPVSVAVWEQPGRTENRVLFIRTRYSAVLRTVFGQKVEWGQGVTMAYVATVTFMAVGGAFLMVELISLVIGINLTHTITRAVHNLYGGTQKVMEGDFHHRIAVRGNDQLAQLSLSFNRMTENLERLIEVAKEKERLQSEIEIAREVQNQLFPKTVPESRTLQLCAVCLPARLVSGDYYDYMALQDSQVAVAIGDVAGKGISAALLMATVQSTMRTQLRAGREMAAAAGNGRSLSSLSTAVLVSRLNQQLYAYTSPEKFATFYFGLYDESTSVLTYTNAGHLPPVVIRRGQPTRLEVNGMIVGAFPFATYGESSIQLERGDLLVCFTDGITEPENDYGEMYGEDRLIDALVKHADSDNEEIVASVTEAVHLWTGSPELQDDMTMLLARRI